MGAMGVLSQTTAAQLAQTATQATEAFAGADCFEQAAQALVQSIHSNYRASVAMARAYVTVPLETLPRSNADWVRNLARSKGIEGDLVGDTQVISLVGSAGREPAWNDRRNSRGHVGIPITSASFIDAIPMMSRLLASLGGDLRWSDRGDLRHLVSRLGTVAGTFYVSDATVEVDAAGRKIISATDFVREHSVRTVFGLGGAFASGELFVVLVFCTELVPRAIVDLFQAPFLRFKTAAAHLLERVFVDGSTTRRELALSQRSLPAQRRSPSQPAHGSDERLAAKERELEALNELYLDLESQLESRTRSLKLILDSTGDGLLLVDFAGRISGEATAIVARWFVAPSAGMDVADVLFAGDSTRAAEFRERFAQLTEGALPFDVAAEQLPRRLTRGEATLQLSYRRVFEKERLAGILIIIQDVTSAVVAERAEEQVREALATASRLKGEFLANMSHEIRTPLNGVTGMAELLATTKLDPEQRSFLSTLLEACQGLGTVVNDILDFSKIEAGKLSIEKVEFELNATLQGVVNMFRPGALRAKNELSLSLPEPGPGRITGDPQRIRQVLMNLVSNAVKFTSAGSIAVRARCTATANTQVRLRVEVEDTGMGISEEAAAQLFQPFVQADGSITRRFGGTGLGLAISRRLIELMGGQIGVDSRLGSGSTFWFELPVALSPVSDLQSVVPHNATTPEERSRWRLLVAEDNAINRQVISAMLHGLGCQVELAQDGKQLVERWRSGEYDGILTDCQMPEMSGFEAATVIRSEERGRRIPIIALTAQAYAEDRERCARAGMDDHLAKPVTIRDLQATLDKWLAPQNEPSAASPTLLAPEAGAVPPVTASAIDAAALDVLRASLGDGGDHVLEALVEEFVADFPRWAARLREDLSGAAAPHVQSAAHHLRSSTLSLAVVNMSATCAQLEATARVGDLEACAELLSRLEQEFIGASQALNQYLHSAC